MSSGMSSRTCYTKLNFDFPYVRSLSLRLVPYVNTLHSNMKINMRFILVNAGASPAFGRGAGGSKILFFRFGNLHVTAFEGMLPEKSF